MTFHRLKVEISNNIKAVLPVQYCIQSSLLGNLTVEVVPPWIFTFFKIPAWPTNDVIIYAKTI